VFWREEVKEEKQFSSKGIYRTKELQNKIHY
jgi:hypothetical protein